MSVGYLTTKFASDLDRLGYRATRKITQKQLDEVEAALNEIAEGDCTVVLDADVRSYIRHMHERASGRPLRAPDFEEVVHSGTWLVDPARPETVGECLDTSGDINPAGLLCLGESRSGEIWLLDVAIRHGYVYLLNERREILPMFRNVSDFAQWAVANELWKRRQASEGEVPARLGKLRYFRSITWLREAGLVPQAFRPKRFKPARPLPTLLSRADVDPSN